MQLFICRKDLEITKRKAENIVSKSPEDLKEPFHTKVCLILNLIFYKKAKEYSKKKVILSNSF